MILVVDNYDSFTYNLVQLLGEQGAELLVVRNDRLNLDELAAAALDGIVISPGPGVPSHAGLTPEVIRRFGPILPVLGVCLGHQAIGEVYGGRVVRAPEIRHGKTSQVFHQGLGVLEGLPNPFEATRYHSLVVEREGLPPELEITAETEDGLIMGLRHREYPVEGVQFHPESILTTTGSQLLANFLRRCSR